VDRLKAFLQRVAVDRARGGRPSAARAMIAAAAAGAAAAGVTYRVLRN
jgi:hypothetical protein